MKEYGVIPLFPVRAFQLSTVKLRRNGWRRFVFFLSREILLNIPGTIDNQPNVPPDHLIINSYIVVMSITVHNIPFIAGLFNIFMRLLIRSETEAAHE